MPRRLGYAIIEGSKLAFAFALITLGIQYIDEGNYEVGGAFVAIGWIWLIINKYVT